jgi:hypothetical protein
MSGPLTEEAHMATNTKTKTTAKELEIGLILAEVDEHLARANACEKSSLERGWTKGSTYSIAGSHIPGRALLVAIIGEGGEAMCNRRELKQTPQATKAIQGLAQQMEKLEKIEVAAELRALAEEIEGPDNINVQDAIDTLLDARSIIQRA